MPRCSARSTGARHGDAGRVPRHAARCAASRRIPMLFQHDPAEPVGIWLELREDARGLFARGRLIPEVARGARAAGAGARPARSTGCRSVFAPSGRASIRRRRIRKLDAIDLWEISIVTFPLLAGARVRAVNGKRRSPSRPMLASRDALSTLAPRPRRRCTSGAADRAAALRSSRKRAPARSASGPNRIGGMRRRTHACGTLATVHVHLSQPDEANTWTSTLTTSWRPRRACRSHDAVVTHRRR